MNPFPVRGIVPLAPVAIPCSTVPFAVASAAVPACARYAELNAVAGSIIVVTGKSGSGKTTAFREAAGLISGRAGSCAGIICPSERTREGLPYRIAATDLETGETRPLAERQPGVRMPFAFNRTTFLWANAILSRAALRMDTILFLDEAGPLEIEDSTGFFPFLAQYLEKGKGRLAVSVRPLLLARFHAMAESCGRGSWTISDIVIKAENRDKISGMIADSLFLVADGQ